MKVADVKKLAPLDQFLYWMRERYNVAIRRRNDLPKPWTDDEVLQTYFFTHPYREMDRVTVWFKDNIREPLRDDPDVIFATVCFRWFNLPETGVVLANYRPKTGDQYSMGLLEDWKPEEALRLLSEVRANREQVFTGAYMINSPGGKPKLEAIIERIDKVWKDRERLVDFFEQNNGLGKSHPLRMEDAHKRLTQYEGLAGFMAYEIVCDLRYTYLLENAPDKMTWCNPGPGCIRGLYRLLGLPFKKGNNASSPPKPAHWDKTMRELLATAKNRLSSMPPLEMREIEHSLCEYDKYMRAIEGDGKLKRKYGGK